MKSSTARKTKKNETPREMTRSEIAAITVRIFLYREGWGVRDKSGIKSFHRTQAEAIEKGRALARKISGQLAIYDRKEHVRKWEVYSGPIILKSDPSPPEMRPVNATVKQIREAGKAIHRKRLAASSAQ